MIKNIQILNFDNEKQILEIYVECSKGTYIRSIANDLGENLGVFGHLIKLIRVKAGSFNIENSIRLEHLENLNIVETNLINPIEHLNYIKYELTDLELERISHGMSIPTTLKDGLVILTYSTNIVAIGKVYSGLIKCEKVFI